MKVGITGQTGFIGSHLSNYLKIFENITRVSFQRDYFESDTKLDSFIKDCDVIVHLAGMNRGSDQEIYKTNSMLTKALVKSLERTGTKPHVIFSSSTHETRDTQYGRSKLDSRKVLANWANQNDANFTGVILPNVFGPFCRPFYNSVVATFCYQLTHELLPEIHVDQTIDLIYINKVVKELEHILLNQISSDKLDIQPTDTIKVSKLLTKLTSFKECYLEKQTIPDITNLLDQYLFNTFRSYVDPTYYPVQYDLKTDERGYLFEIVKSLNQGQAFFSTTKPGVERGNHYHRRKVERFSIIKGKASVKLRRIGTNEVIEYILDGNNPSYVDMPIHVTHNLVNIGDEDLLMLFWTSELYNPEDPDTFYEKVTGEFL